jgi:hypothetical protein
MRIIGPSRATRKEMMVSKYAVALTLGALAAAAANPALACGGAGGKAYRAAHSVQKSTVTRKEEPASASVTLDGLQGTPAPEDSTVATAQL